MENYKENRVEIINAFREYIRECSYNSICFEDLRQKAEKIMTLEKSEFPSSSMGFHLEKTLRNFPSLPNKTKDRLSFYEDFCSGLLSDILWR